MYKFFTLMLLFAFSSCDTQIESSNTVLGNYKTTTNTETPLTFVQAKPTNELEPFELKMTTTALDKEFYSFDIKILLRNGAHFVSPNAKRDFKGKFMVHVDDNSKLKLISELIETPLSVEEIDPHPFVNGTVNWVREDTNYQLKLKRTTDESFHVKGYIQFTIEPRCTLEKIPFIIRYGAGKLRVERNRC